MAEPAMEQPADPKKRAMRFVLLLGVVSLLADVTYEGARSATGPFLALLGASGTAVGIVAGLGEFIGYGLRFVSGRWADRTRAYWRIAIFGYIVNLVAVPALALAGSWQVAALLIILERTGKAIRNPSRDTMLSHAAHQVGAGWAFGYHNALDQVGAAAGPLIVAGAVFFQGDYRLGFALLAVPAAAALTTLYLTWRANPTPQDLEPAAKPFGGPGLTRPYWIYLAGACLLAAGFADFALLAFHLGRTGALGAAAIPALYSMAMAASAVGGLAMGRAFDRWGARVLLLGALLPAPSAPLILLGGTPEVVLGAALWGLGLGVQGSLFKAIVRGLVPADRRASAFGTFDGLFGVAWFAGSAVIGVLYDLSVFAAAMAALGMQLAALPFLLYITSRREPPPPL